MPAGSGSYSKPISLHKMKRFLLLFLILMTIPATSFSQRFGDFSEAFDTLWGCPPSKFPGLKFLKASEDDITVYSGPMLNTYLGNIGTLAFQFIFANKRLGQIVMVIDPAYVDMVVPRTIELYGPPTITEVQEDGEIKIFTWEQGNTEMIVVYFEEYEGWTMPMVEVSYGPIDIDKIQWYRYLNR